MPLLDERGRLFGRVNLIDAAVLGFVLLLIPLAYAGYALFRAPTPTVSSVEPRTVTDPKGTTLEMKGEHLRPYFRAHVGATVVEYLFATPDRAVLKLPELPAGEHEIALYDEAQLITKAGTITVVPPARVRNDPQATVTVVGTFNRLQAREAAVLKAGLTLPATIDPAAPGGDALELLSVQAPRPAVIPLADGSSVQLVDVADRVQVVAVARVHGRSVGNGLTFADKRVLPGVDLVLPVEMATSGSASASPGAAGPQAPAKASLTFTVQRAFPGTPTPLDVRVRFITRPEILPSIQRDVRPGGSHDPFQELLPQVLSVRVTSELDGGTRLEQREGRITILDAMVRLPGVRSAEGWQYDGRPLKPGIELFLDTPGWVMSGIVLSMEPVRAAKQ